MPARFTPLLSAPEIDMIVSQFYARVRQHPELGPVFASHVTDWTAHEAKIASFWRNVLMRERGYSGNPMQKHLDAGNVHAEHFVTWLDLFDEVLNSALDETKAQHWSMLAHRIGQSLRFGLEYASVQPRQDPPSLTL